MPYQMEMKGIKFLQKRADDIEKCQDEIGSELEDLKLALMSLNGADDLMQTEEYAQGKQEMCDDMSLGTPLSHTGLPEIYALAQDRYLQSLGLADILSIEDFADAEARVHRHVLDFNRRYELDGWDYAIAGSCGLFAAMLDIFFVRAPSKPTVAWTNQVDGTFNKWSQQAFNKVLPHDRSKKLSHNFTIGAPDSSQASNLINAPSKAMNPWNHRLRALSHDPVLGFFFGAWDMRHGTCTTVVKGKLISISSKKGPTAGSVPELLLKMLGHLFSDVNAQSLKENRGMGLPAPFMGLLRMLEGIPVGDSNFGKQIEWLYVKGYDIRQFTATGIPMIIMEVLMRCFYVGKQMSLYGASFGEALLETMPGRMNPRFRVMLALAYGTSSAVNGGKMYITQNILNASYASWMGLAWNGFYALKWALLNKHLQLWDEVATKEVAELESLIIRMDELEEQAMRLPI